VSTAGSQAPWPPGSPADLQVWLEAQRRAVDAALECWVPDARTAPAAVADAMRYSLFAGGKRLRPMLVLAAAEAIAESYVRSVDEARSVAMPAACAVELIHTYSLVHDDLPAMDDDCLRRGRPTAHVVFGEGMAILAGDALLTEAFALLADEPTRASGIDPTELSRRKLRAIAVIARAAGATGMVGGQAIDLLATAPDATPFDPPRLRDMHARKTGALIHASASAGAIMAGADTAELQAISLYATQIGLAFQIVDDILDVEGASADLGKTAGKDAAAGKPTYPSVYGLEESRRLAAECVERAISAIAAASIASQLPAIARWVVSRTS
jgi:geranylgeranyl pyrophosphate synthase